MKINRILTLFILIAIILVQATPYFITIAFGSSVSMLTYQYDPRDILRGDYMNIRFVEENISNRKYIDENGNILQEYDEDEDDLDNFDIFDSLDIKGEYYSTIPPITIDEEYLELYNKEYNDADDDYDYYKISNATVYASIKPFNNTWKIVKISLSKPKSGIYIKCENDYIYENKFSDINFNLNRVYIKEGTGADWEDIDENSMIMADMKVFHGRAVITGLRIINDL